VRADVSEIDLINELRPTRVSVGAVTYAPGGTLGPRTQRDVQLVLVHAGSALVWVDGAGRRIAAGNVGLLLPGHRERFAFDANGPTHHSWVQAHVPDLPTATRDRLRALPTVLALSPALEALAREAVATAGSALPTAQVVLAQLAAAAVWRYVGEAEREEPQRVRPVDEAQRFIHAHLHEPELTLGAVARAAHVTPAHLIRSFRAEQGTTPIAYLWQRRVALGIDLLANTGLPLAAVAERCGFKTAHHFSRRVKQATGLPPAALRRASWDRGAASR
jgi:AraC-like DNA-binding protein/quercetin dioxygenase-like cupin family protein